jgi:CubicO group peptidase (beta-lactamase class C family)
MVSTALVGDYMRFIRMWLNDGAGERGRVLQAETVQMAEKNHLGDKKVTMLPGVIPSLSNDAEFFPGLSKSWALKFMVNDEEAPTGRPAGALGWAGLANLFYWIDRKNGFAVSGRRRFCRSEIRYRSAGTSISKPPCTTACDSRRRPDVRTFDPR